MRYQAKDRSRSVSGVVGGSFESCRTRLGFSDPGGREITAGDNSDERDLAMATAEEVGAMFAVRDAFVITTQPAT